MNELLAALMIIGFLVPVSVVLLRLSMNLLDFNENVQDEIATAQLRRIIALSYDIEVSSDSISIEYLGREMRLIYGNSHVYLTPGTQIFYSNIEDAWFMEEGKVIYVCIERNSRISKIAIGTSF